MFVEGKNKELSNIGLKKQSSHVLKQVPIENRNCASPDHDQETKAVAGTDILLLRRSCG